MPVLNRCKFLTISRRGYNLFAEAQNVKSEGRTRREKEHGPVDKVKNNAEIDAKITNRQKQAAKSTDESGKEYRSEVDLLRDERDRTNTAGKHQTCIDVGKRKACGKKRNRWK